MKTYVITENLLQVCEAALLQMDANLNVTVQTLKVTDAPREFVGHYEEAHEKTKAAHAEVSRILAGG